MTRATTALALALALSTGAAAAQTAPDDLARAAFDEGMRGLGERRYHDAALSFERSYALRPVPVVLYDLALAYRGMGRYRAAIDAFTRYLAAPGDVTPERRGAIADEVRDLEARLVRVELSVTPPEAAVSVDGRAVAPSERSLALDPGSHVFDCALAGWRPAHREVAGAPGERATVRCALEMLRDARLVVEPSVQSASVWIDGRPAGTGRVERVLDPGEHRVDVRAPGHVALTRTARLGPTGVVRLSLTLERERGPLALGLAVTGGVVVAGAAAVAIYYAARPASDAPVDARWGNVQEQRP